MSNLSQMVGIKAGNTTYHTDKAAWDLKREMNVDLRLHWEVIFLLRTGKPY